MLPPKLKSWKKVVELSIARGLYRRNILNRKRRSSMHVTSPAVVEFLEARTLLSAMTIDADPNESALGTHEDDHPIPMISIGDTLEIIASHHTEPGHSSSPDTHFFAETGDSHHFAWQDQIPSTPDVTDIFYDFRSRNGYANVITAGQKIAAQAALQTWEDATLGKINFVHSTTVSEFDIINIGTGNLAAFGYTSDPGGILALGGGIFTHNANHTINRGIAWLDVSENWDTVIGNGNPAGTFDYYTVVAHEIGHALGLGHADNIPGIDLMDGIYSAEQTGASSNDIEHIQSIYSDATDNTTLAGLNGVAEVVGATTTELIVNGDFETGDLTGWSSTSIGIGGWQINDGQFDPPGPGTPLAPISGNFDIVSSQTTRGANLISETFTVPANITSATLSWSDRIRNYANIFDDFNQEWRVLVLNENGTLIQEVFSTNPGDPLQQIGPNHRSFDLTSLLQSLEGQSISISFEELRTFYYFNVTLDNVSLLVESGNNSTLAVDLNGDDDAGIDFAASFTEDGGSVLIVDTDLAVYAGTEPTGPIQVAVIGGGPLSDDSGFQEIVAQLNDDTYFDFNAILVQPEEVDTLTELNAYDVVVIGGSGQGGGYSNAFAVYQAPLREWVEAGGGVVMAGWGVWDAGTTSGPIHPDINAIIPVDTDARFGFVHSGTVYFEGAGHEFSVDGQESVEENHSPIFHPVIEGVSDFTLSFRDYVEYSQGGADLGALVLGTTNGQATVVVGDVENGRSVYLGPIYSGTTSRFNNSELRSGDPDHLLENAVAWAGMSLAPVLPSSSSDIYTTHSNGTRIGIIDSNTGIGTDIGATGTNHTWAAAFDTDGSETLYTLTEAFSGNARLATVNTTTGIVTTVSGPGTGTSMISLEVASDGTMYGIGYSDRILYRIDKTTGDSTPVGYTGILSAMDLAFDSSGTLWATVNNRLWTVDTSTGASTFQANITGISSGSVMGIMFDASDTLLATALTVNSPLYVISTTTGIATIVNSNTTFSAPHGGDILLAADSDGLINSATVTITNLLDGTDESLSIITAGSGITASYNSSTGTLTLSGTQSAAAYEQVLRTVTYNNTSQDPNTADRLINFVVTSGSHDSEIATSVVSVAAVNDVPVINSFDLSVNVNQINEGDSVILSGTFTDPDAGDTHLVEINWGDGSANTILNLAAGVSSFSIAHTYADDNPTGTALTLNKISVTVQDNSSISGTAITRVQIRNVAPVLSNVSITPMIDENGVAVLNGIISDVGIQDTFTVVIDWNVSGNAGGSGEGTTTLTHSELTDLGGGQWSFSTSHQYLDDNPTASSEDTYEVGITVTDDDGGIGSGSTSVLVKNVAPVMTTLSSSSPASNKAAEGEEVTISGSFTDIGTLDLHTASINWGDGTSSAATIDETNGSGTISGNHAYLFGGIYTVTVTLADDDNGLHELTTTVFVTGIGLHEVDGQTVLQIIGTNSADHITINQQGNGLLKVHADFLQERNGFRTYDSSDIDLLFIFLCEGDDHVTVAGNVDISTLIYGGGGDDHINGGGGSNIILGGAGNDRIVGGSGRDILIGGTGIDRIIGGPGQDIITGSSTTYGFSTGDDLLANSAALLAIQQEWNAETAQADRKANLSDDDASSTRLNADFFTRLGLEILDDTEADILTGSSAEDWFLLSNGDRVTDGSLQSNSNAGGNGKGKGGNS